ncbi:phenazine biosynthesis protein PhzF family [Brucella pseudogrignonensis]|uniref:PhzF family phenazine biosynthesis protein n=1 Tax=Brucella pseudogrignonensis TaxID=419475 RepID=UPI0007DAAE8F|nr:PhzF family phenazine biosynthesis protein [Brucella pseudogrignonensis]ANG98126.1 phenazine biosynthesis protein PhzF family [Brucella pseudogrignonensis]
MPQVLEMYQVDAFTKRVFAGNPAAVLILKDWLSDATMQAIAAENNLAETAFACPAEDGWKLRWFTPTLEVDFCGHATLATAHVLAWHHKIDGELNFYTRIGKISVSRVGDDYVLDVPSIAPDQLSELPAFIAPLFENESGATFFRNFENIYVQLEDEAAVRAFVPDHIQIEKLGSVGLVITARGSSHDFVSRYFAAGSGIPEDPVTGSIHATLVPYWAQKIGKDKLSAYQASARGGHLGCELKGDRVLLTGNAVTFMKAEIYIP